MIGERTTQTPIIGIRAYNNDVHYTEGKPIDFIVDHIRIKPTDIIIISSEILTSFYKKEIADHDEQYIQVRLIPFTHPVRFLRNLKGISKEEIWAAAWNTILDLYQIRHFIVYNDFTDLSPVRNKVLKNRGCETWFYTHATNTAEVFGGTSKGIIPFEILNYDHLVAWNEQIADTYVKNGGTFGQVHIIGCIRGV